MDSTRCYPHIHLFLYLEFYIEYAFGVSQRKFDSLASSHGNLPQATRTSSFIIMKILHTHHIIIIICPSYTQNGTPAPIGRCSILYITKIIYINAW